MFKTRTILASVIVMLGSLSALNAHESHRIQDSLHRTEAIDSPEQKDPKRIDTVYLNQESKPRHVISLERNTRGIKENKGKYGIMALISLVVVAVIGFLIFRSRD